MTDVTLNDLSLDDGKPTITGPIRNSGKLDEYFKQKNVTFQEHTPIIGRSYSEQLQLTDLLKASDEVLSDFALQVSTRGVVFLEKQDINAQDMQVFMKRFHEAAGAPKASGLHIHPSQVNDSEHGDTIQRISSEVQKKAGGDFWRFDRKFLASRGWHSDISFEPCPSDYSMLKIVIQPPVGGDTLFASGEELYNRLSPSFAAYLETLSAYHYGAVFHEEAARNTHKIHLGPRGSPLNVGNELGAVHPVVRTNPVTGKKAIFVNKGFTKYIIGMTPHESENILKFLFELMVHNHDLQVRLKWQPGTLALWDNRSNYHIASFDFHGERLGERACAVGERPFFDPNWGKQ